MKNSVEDLITKIRPVIARQSGIDINDIINSDSITGPELTKIVDGKKVPYQTFDNFIVFEFTETPNVNIYETYDDGKVHAINSYALFLTIYGDKSRTISLRLKARMFTSEVQEYLSNIGISITRFGTIESSTETINTMVYIRRDMSIHFINEMAFDLIDEAESILSAEIKNINTN